MYSQATIPVLISKSENQTLANLTSVIGGVLLISLLAQIVIPLPWTPVPITGQTFAVSFVSLLWGSKRGFSVVSLYLLLGGLGLPIFAFGKSGFLLGPTAGYLVGMLVASAVVGFLADKGFSKRFFPSLAAAYIGSAIVFAMGVLGLSYFVPTKDLFIMGVLPFLFGDAVKNMLAAYLAVKVRKKL